MGIGLIPRSTTALLPEIQLDNARQTWKALRRQAASGLPECNDYVGPSPLIPIGRNIPYDVTKPVPLLNEIEAYRSEEFFEHIP